MAYALTRKSARRHAPSQTKPAIQMGLRPRIDLHGPIYLSMAILTNHVHLCSPGQNKPSSLGLENRPPKMVATYALSTSIQSQCNERRWYLLQHLFSTSIAEIVIMIALAIGLHKAGMTVNELK